MISEADAAAATNADAAGAGAASVTLVQVRSERASERGRRQLEREVRWPGLRKDLRL